MFAAVGYPGGLIYCDMVEAELLLREGDLAHAKEIFEKSLLVTLEKGNIEGAEFTLERLADFRNGMDNLQNTLKWTALYLGISMKSKNKLAVLKALRCLGIILIEHGDGDSALTLLGVVLEGFTSMDVHRWRADCMVQMSDIYAGRGDLMRSRQLWTLARPLFERSSQRKAASFMETKLAATFEF
jgi:hypothetical protein